MYGVFLRCLRELVTAMEFLIEVNRVRNPQKKRRKKHNIHIFFLVYFIRCHCSLISFICWCLLLSLYVITMPSPCRRF